MMLTVQLFGLSSEIAGLRDVTFQLKDGASLVDVIATLRDKYPALEGPVIRAGENRLTESQAFNVNGHFYYDNRDVQLQGGDHIALLTLATGG